MGEESEQCQGIGDIFGFVGVTEFQAARTFGVDVNFKF